MARKFMGAARRPWNRPTEPMKKANTRDTPEQVERCFDCPFPDDCKAGWRNICPLTQTTSIQEEND